MPPPIHSTDFLKNCLLNIKGETFPEGSLMCLQLLAFWLSYVRHFWTKDGVLRLGQDVLDALKAHAARKDLATEEHELAEKLFEDFGRWPALEEFEDNGIKDVPAPAASHAEAPAPPPDPEALKEAGNKLFKQGDWAAAIDKYTAAIAAASSDGDGAAGANPKLAAYYGNRSAAHAKLSEAHFVAKEKRAEHFEACVADCDAALKSDATYVKALYRKANMLTTHALKQKDAEEKISLLRVAEVEVGKARDLAPSDETIATLGLKIREALMIADGP